MSPLPGSTSTRRQTLGLTVILGRGAFSRHINLAGLDILHLGPFGEVPNIVQFGFSNPAGLRNKGEIAVGLGPGVWSFSETHLSQVTQRSCASIMHQLAAAEGRNLYAHMGAAVMVEWSAKLSATSTKRQSACASGLRQIKSPSVACLQVGFGDWFHICSA